MEKITANNNMLMDRTSRLLSKALDLRSARQNVISGNLANAETPGYIQKELPFEQELQKAFDKKRIKLETSEPEHISGNRHIMEDNFNPYKLVREYGKPNELNIDTEMAKMAKNNLLYEASATLLSKKFASLKAVIESGR
ncbi:MAG: flagellar basal body rod protein FlgB [Deltaproteobacteria bacterium]|nr:flagellar basal body rod protein FlgB [Deltaproteobacteria bacterium]